VGGLGGEREDRGVEADLGVADLELGGVHADGKAAGTGVDVVADEGALAGFVPAAPVGEGERERRDDLAFEQVGAEIEGHAGGQDGDCAAEDAEDTEDV